MSKSIVIVICRSTLQEITYYDNWYYLEATNGDMKSDAFIRYNDGWYLLLPDGRLEEKPAFTVEPDGKITTMVGKDAKEKLANG